MRIETDFDKYQNIITKREVPPSKRRRMSGAERACQFAPFAALCGFDEVISEQSRLTDRKIELGEYEREQLDLAISRATSESTPHTLMITYFVKDEKKSGGKYLTVKDSIKRLDEIKGILITDGGRQISLSDLLFIEEQTN